ncbi:DUF4258 domain-containing protein [Rhizobium sp. AC44/96]|uniref:DUF4258 domain-containing protein n=1 Tax=Rhizobium sp. AC44/96 TaxID=1841654 RepID=UPI0034E0A264
MRALIADDKFRISAHALKELLNDDLLIEPLVTGISSAVPVEEYPQYHKGPCVLVLQTDERGGPIHLLWGIPCRCDLAGRLDYRLHSRS